MIFFESRDCSKKLPPLSSFRIRDRQEYEEGSATLPAWEKDLRRAVREARVKLEYRLKPKRKPSKRKSGDGASGGNRVERHRVESCLR